MGTSLKLETVKLDRYLQVVVPMPTITGSMQSASGAEITIPKNDYLFVSNQIVRIAHTNRSNKHGNMFFDQFNACLW